MKKILQFGETLEGYDVLVINEREARAGAGILFLFGIISFLNAFWMHDFHFTQVFITVFMIDFFIRIFINPRFAPSLILGRIFTQNQVPEYVGAPQKRWAWSIGFVLSVIMFVLVVILSVMTPIKIIICILCLLLLFSETAFGICIGCALYNFIYPNQAKHCPGGSCEIRQKEEIQKLSFIQVTIASLALLLGTGFTYYAYHDNEGTSTPTSMSKCGAGKCGMGKCGGS